MLGDIPNTEEIKPLIIFGAGASHDLISPNDDAEFAETDWKPPLSNNLFDGNNNFIKGIIANHPSLQPLISVIRKKIHKGITLEEALDREQLQEEFGNDSIHLSQYLSRLFLLISRNCSESVVGNNYQAFFKLLDRITKKYLIVNFNYDFLAQKALDDTRIVHFSDFNSYINSRVKLVHVHGSVIWERYGDGRLGIGSYKNGGGSANISIPIINGKEYACPTEHVNALNNFLMNEANLVIIVGWKGVESHFKKTLQLLVNPPRRIIIIGGEKSTYENGEEILKNCGLDRFKNIQKIFINGFSNLFNYYDDFAKPPLRENFFYYNSGSTRRPLTKIPIQNYR